MAGQLDSLLKKVAKKVVSDLGSSLDTTITYTRKGQSSYNIDTGEEISIDTSFSDIKVPIEFIRSEEDLGREIREFKTYITPDLIGGNQPNLDDEITLTYAGSTRVAKIVNISTLQGGQSYLFTILGRF